MTTSTIDFATEAKKAAAEAADAQRKAEAAQARAAAAQAEAQRRHDAAYEVYADSVMSAFKDSKTAAEKAEADAFKAFEKAVISGTESVAAYARLLEARADSYVLIQERNAVVSKRGGITNERAQPPRNMYEEEASRILHAHTQQMIRSKLDDMRDRRDELVAKELGKS